MRSCSHRKDNLVYHQDNQVVDWEGLPVSSIIRTTERRRCETPAGVMTTFASPTLGATAGLSMWEVAMTAGARGPLHVFDSEQIWTVLDGELSVAIAGRSEDIHCGDTVVIPAGLERQISARTDVHLLVCGHASAIARVPGEREPRGTPAWIA
jgi:quercetin dioxygenase-like cupin family protein